MTQYEKLNFVNGSPPALSAATLNHMEDGIAAATDGVTALEETVTEKADTENVYTVEEADEHFLSKHDAGNTYAKKSEVNIALSGKLDNTAGAVTTDKLADELKNSINGKAEKATTLVGYHITDGENIRNKVTDKPLVLDADVNYPTISYLYKNFYERHDIDHALSGKLDNTAGSVKTDNIASKAITNDKIANGAITNFKLAIDAVSGNNIAQGQINTGHLQNGAVTTDKLADEVKTSINSKYDSSNVETGHGALTPYNENMSNKINSASFSYQRNGSYVTVSVYIDFNAFTVDNASINIMLSGLPYTYKGTVNLRELCVTTGKQNIIYAVAANTNVLTLLFFNTGTFAESEKLSLTFSYKIS